MPTNGSRVTIRELYSLMEAIRAEARRDREQLAVDVKSMIRDFRADTDREIECINEGLRMIRIELDGEKQTPGIKATLLTNTANIRNLEQRDWKMLIASVAAAIAAYVGSLFNK